MSKPHKRLATIRTEREWDFDRPWIGMKARTYSELKKIFRRKERRALNDATRDGSI